MIALNNDNTLAIISKCAIDLILFKYRIPYWCGCYQTAYWNAACWRLL